MHSVCPGIFLSLIIGCIPAWLLVATMYLVLIFSLIIFPPRAAATSSGSNTVCLLSVPKCIQAMYFSIPPLERTAAAPTGRTEPPLNHLSFVQLQAPSLVQ
jgi:hypothetical protein